MELEIEKEGKLLPSVGFARVEREVSATPPCSVPSPNSYQSRASACVVPALIGRGQSREDVDVQMLTGGNSLRDGSDGGNSVEIKGDAHENLEDLTDTPARLDNQTVIYNLNVETEYPNIILTNSMQSSARVDETVCTANDFNRSGQRRMTCMWRGEGMPVSSPEYHGLQQHFETRKIPQRIPGGMEDGGGELKAFHRLGQGTPACPASRDRGKPCGAGGCQAGGQEGLQYVAGRRPEEP